MKYLFHLTCLVIPSLLLAASPEQKITPLPLPAIQVASPTYTLGQLREKADALEEKIGAYPPRLADATDRQKTYQVWSYLLADARAHQAAQGNTETVTKLLLQLYRQGHNLDVISSARNALNLFEEAFKKYPDSVPILREASWFFMQISPPRTSFVEETLLKLRALLKTDKDIEVERGFVYVYLFQKKIPEAQKQIDHCLSINPDIKDLLELKTHLANAKVEVVSKEAPAPAPKKSNRNKDRNDIWFKSFYRTQDISYFPAFWKDAIKRGALTEQSDSHAPVVAFASQVIRRHPGLVKGRMDNLAKIPRPILKNVLAILAYANTPETRAIIAQDPRYKELLDAPPLDISACEATDPAILDFCWGWFFATGDTAALDPIIVALDKAKHTGAMENYKSSAKTEADRAAAYQEAICQAAIWSLMANAKEDPKIADHLENTLHKIHNDTSVPDERKSCLYFVLSQINPEKYPPPSQKE